MQKKLQVQIAGLERTLPLQRVDEDRILPIFVGFNDVALTKEAASQLLKQVVEFDCILTEELQGVPLAYEMSRQADKARYVVARKQAKAYMADVAAIQLEVDDDGDFYTPRRYLSKDDAEYLKGKRVLLVDDMVMAGGRSLKVLEELALALGAYVVGKAAILRHDDVEELEDLVTLATLPVFADESEIEDL